HAVEREIVNVLSAAGEKTKVLDPFDRASDECVGCALAIQRGCRLHMTMAACSLRSARATLKAASAEVLGFVRDGFPCSVMANRPAAPSTSISCTLPGASGSATSSTCVISKPSPASATAAATLAFCG